MGNYGAEMVRTGEWWHMVITDIDSQIVVYTGPRRKDRNNAAIACIAALRDMQDAARRAAAA